MPPATFLQNRLHFPVGTYFLNGDGQGGAAAVHVAVNRESDIPGGIGKLPLRSVEENSVAFHDALAHEKLQMIGSHALGRFRGKNVGTHE